MELRDTLRLLGLLSLGIALGIFAGQLSAPNLAPGRARRAPELSSSDCSPGPPARVLALDSSVASLRLLLGALVELESQVNFSAFDLVVGTGAGAIAAAGLANGLKPSELVNISNHVGSLDALLENAECSQTATACPEVAAARCVLLMPQTNLTGLIAPFVDARSAGRRRAQAPSLAIPLFDIASGHTFVVTPAQSDSSSADAADSSAPSYKLQWLLSGADSTLSKQPQPPFRLMQHGKLASGTSLRDLLAAAAATPLLAAPRNLTCIGCDGGGQAWGSPYSACTSWKTHPRLCTLVAADSITAAVSATMIGLELAGAPSHPNGPAAGGCTKPARIHTVSITAHSSAATGTHRAPAAPRGRRGRGHAPSPSSVLAISSASRSSKELFSAALQGALGADGGDATWGPYGQVLAPMLDSAASATAELVRAARSSLETVFAGQSRRAGIELHISLHPPSAAAGSTSQSIVGAIDGRPATREAALHALTHEVGIFSSVGEAAA